MDVKAKLAEIVGSSNVSDAPEDLVAFSRDYSLCPPRMPSYVVRPKNTEEVQKIIRLANEIKMPVVPSSSGIHFNGATIPLQSGIMLDLRRMNRTLEIDERNRKVRIEPGVTWGQLQSELEKHHLRALIPLLPHPLKSALTSHLEREPILIPKMEYSDPMMATEVIWPNGKYFRTGTAVVPGYGTTAISDGVNPAGPGLDWWRLFQGAQGTMGVMTWTAAKVEYLPEVSKIFFLPFDQIENSIEPMYRIQRRMIGHECFLLNKLNLAAILAEKAPQDVEDLMVSLPEWTLIIVLGGGRRHPEVKLEYEEESLREIIAEFPVTRILTALPGVPQAEKKLPEMLRRPWPEDRTYWKFAYRGSCQDLFFLTTLEKVPGFMEVLKQALGAYGIRDTGFYIQPIEYGRICHFECDIYYDGSAPRDVEIVGDFYAEVVKRLLDHGAFFSRPYGIIADLVYSRAAGYTIALKKLKKLLDPNNILSPGRLCF